LEQAEAIKAWRRAFDASDALSSDQLLNHARSFLQAREELLDRDDHLRLLLPVRAQFRGGRAAMLVPNGAEGKSGRPDIALIKAIARAHKRRAMLQRGKADSIDSIAKRFGLDRFETGKTLGLACLSPAITRSILEGSQHPALRLKHLLDAEIPLA
jgi:hypothetical protein